MQTLITAEFAIAERFDKRKISRAEAAAEESQAVSHLNTEMQLRAQAWRTQQASEQAAKEQSDRVQQQALQEAQAKVDAQKRYEQCVRSSASAFPGVGNPFAKAELFCSGRASYSELNGAAQNQIPFPFPRQTICNPAGYGVICNTH